MIHDLGRAFSSVKGALLRERVRLKNRMRLPPVRLVHHPAYDLESNDRIDGRRGSRILEYLVLHRWVDRADVISPRPLSAKDLLRVHDAAYLARLDEASELDRIFGGMVSPGEQADRVLAAQRLMAAGTATATHTALRFPRLGGPVVNLGGGLHHARRAVGAGFCAFNDVAIAIDAARQHGFDGRVLVVDLDAHHGDGTRSMFADDDRVFTFSLHTRPWDESPAVASLDVELGPSPGDETYLDALTEHLPEAVRRARPDLVFYLAGADVLETDPLGGMRVTLEGALERDRRILSEFSRLPMVVTLAGGYGPLAWRAPTRMLLWLLAGAEIPLPTGDELALDRFRNIRLSLSGSLLSGQVDRDAPFRLTEEDIYGALARRDDRFLHFYTRHGLDIAFERYGLAEFLRARGYPEFDVEVRPPDAADTHFLRVFADARRELVLIELSLRELVLEDDLRMLSIEWLLLQDPRRQPDQDHPLLPGQKHPGLGCLKIIIGMLVMAAERLGYDGLTVVPSHFHVAAQSKRLMGFLDPVDEARFVAMLQATAGLSLLDASHALDGGAVVDPQSGEPVRYQPMRLAAPTSEKLRARLKSPAYARAVEQAARELALTGTRTAG